MDFRKKGCRFAIIGSGNAGIISALMILFSYKYNGHPVPEIVMYTDSKIPTEIVGQGTTVNVSTAIEFLLANEAKNNTAGLTPKAGFYYRNWCKNPDMYYKLGGSGLAYHFDPNKLRQTFLDKNYVRVVEKNVTPEEIKDRFDLVIDCRGKTANDWEDYDEVASPVNCALLGRTSGFRPKEVWTEHIATPDGWAFKIPLEDGHSYGYIFNEDITDTETAKKNFKDLLGVDTLHKIPFKNYRAKKYYDAENKTLLNGNRLFFYEPLESNATPFYGTLITDILFKSIDNGGKFETDANRFKRGLKNFDTKIKQMHEWILWHYYYGSHYDTPFWRYAKDMARNYEYSEDFINLVETARVADWDNYVGQYVFHDGVISEYTLHDYISWMFENGGLEAEHPSLKVKEPVA